MSRPAYSGAPSACAASSASNYSSAYSGSPASIYHSGKPSAGPHKYNSEPAAQTRATLNLRYAQPSDPTSDQTALIANSALPGYYLASDGRYYPNTYDGLPPRTHACENVDQSKDRTVH